MTSTNQLVNADDVNSPITLGWVAMVVLKTNFLLKMDDTVFSLLQTQEMQTRNSSSTGFAEVTDDMVVEMNKKKRRKSTENSIKTQTNILRNYLKEINHPKASDFESFEKQELAETLK